jgi:hypothetical protein
MEAFFLFADESERVGLIAVVSPPKFGVAPLSNNVPCRPKTMSRP